MRAAEEKAAAAKGEGGLGKCADDEPVFILRAQDVLASDSIRWWADRLEARAVGRGEYDQDRQQKVSEARRQAIEMDEWRSTHGGGKLPD